MSAVQTKDTIYIDAEDEITAIIDKVHASQAKVIALVLPKRAATLQSIVNLKLLKRTAHEAKKNLVLITSEPGLLPIAGAVGMHVAKTLQSKPAIPAQPKLNEQAITVDGESSESSDLPIDTQATVGQLAGHVAAEETIELDNDEIDNAPVAGDKKFKKSKDGINKKLKIPNFDRFRLLLFGGIALLILLIVGSVFAFIILPKAKIVIKTDTTNVSTSLLITANVDAKAIDETALIVPAQNKQLKKTDADKVPATGQRDDGEKATGIVTITNCNKTEDSISLPAGTTLSTSNGGTALAFVTNEAVTIAQSNFTGGGVCKNDSFKNVAVTAQSAGGQYNLGAHRQFSTSISGVSGTDSNAMSGGTSKLVQVVSQADIEKAKQKVIDRITESATNELKTLFSTDKYIGLADTLTASTPAIVSTPNVNEPAAEVSVSVTVTFGELGVKQDDVKLLIENNVNKNIDTNKQIIQDNGLDKAVILVVDKKSPTEVKFELKALSVAGPQLDTEGIKKQIAGKRKGEAQKLIQDRPGIRDVIIDYDPFWVYSTPKNPKKITIIFEQNNPEQQN